MKTLEQFKEEMKWNIGNWTNEQLHGLYSSINNESYLTLEEIAKEYDENDFTITSDVSIVALIDNLTNSGYESEMIIDLISKGYSEYNVNSHTIEFYYLSKDEIYCMIIGS